MATEKFEAWAIVELFGHQRVAGQISDFVLGGETFVRVDIPQAGEKPFYTRLFGKGAIYCINLVDEKAARLAAEHMVSKPTHAWELETQVRRLERDAARDASVTDAQTAGGRRSDDDYDDDVPI